MKIEKYGSFLFRNKNSKIRYALYFYLRDRIYEELKQKYSDKYLLMRINIIANKKASQLLNEIFPKEKK